jgi:transcriptional regulator with AAA-type ATPase domain
VTDSRTATASRGDARATSERPPAPRDFLCLALECERPLEPPARYALEGLDEVLIGRGAPRRAELETSGGTRRLRLHVPDGRMSATHARLTREMGRWVLEDQGSKNGVLLDGALQRRALLEGENLIELGHTFLLYTRRPAPAGLPLESLADVRPAPEGSGLSTFVPRLHQELAALREVARSAVPIVLLGETGTGKDVLARAVHALSGRAGPFLAINCGALPSTLIESELFGHRRGAFTGATEDRPGLFRAASGGTLFLDEIGDLPLPLQAAFLRVLQEGEVLPLGAEKPVRVDVRVVAATHRDLHALVQREAFRSDLYARLSGLTVRVPPLRERREDLGILVAAILPRVARQPGSVTFGSDAARALFRHDWPLNVRELEKALEVATVLARGGRVELQHLPEALRTTQVSKPLPAARSAAGGELGPEDLQRRDELVTHLRAHRGNISAVARAMGVARMQVHRFLRRFGIDPAAYRE